MYPQQPPNARTQRHAVGYGAYRQARRILPRPVAPKERAPAAAQLIGRPHRIWQQRERFEPEHAEQASLDYGNHVIMPPDDYFPYTGEQEEEELSRLQEQVLSVLAQIKELHETLKNLAAKIDAVSLKVDGVSTDISKIKNVLESSASDIRGEGFPEQPGMDSFMNFQTGQ